MTRTNTPTIAEQLKEYCDSYLTTINERTQSKIPTHSSNFFRCGNDVFDVLSLDANTVATSHKAKPEVMIWEIQTGSLIHSIDTKIIQNWELLRLSDSLLLVGSFLTKSLQLINWRTAQVERVISLESSIMYYGHRVMKAFGRNNNLIVAGLESNKLIIFDLTGTFVTTFTGHTRGVTCVEIVPGGRIITGSWDTTLKMWDVGTSVCAATFSGHSGPITSVCLLNETNIVSGSYDYSIRLWDINTATCIRHIGHCTDWIREILVFSPSLICSVADDKKVRVWDVEENKCVRVLEGHTGCVNCVTLNQDSLISGSADGTIRVWR